MNSGLCVVARLRVCMGGWVGGWVTQFSLYLLISFSDILHQVRVFPFSIEVWISKGFKLKRARGPLVHLILLVFALRGGGGGGGGYRGLKKLNTSFILYFPFFSSPAFIASVWICVIWQA